MPKRKDKRTRTRGKQKNWNTPYTFDENMLTKDGRLVQDNLSAWVTPNNGGFQINVQLDQCVRARYTKVTDLHFVYWLAYDLMMKSQKSGFIDTMSIPVICHTDNVFKVPVKVV